MEIFLGALVDKVALGKRFLRIPHFSFVSVIQFHFYDYYPFISNTKTTDNIFK